MIRPIYTVSRLSAVALSIFTVGLLSSTSALAETNIVVQMTTGSDDLRGGNNAFISLNLVDGTSTPEVSLGGGFGQNSRVRKRVTFRRTVSLAQIRSITIRHDGSPRRGHPADGYDNWDLQKVSASLAGRNIYNSVNDGPRSQFVQRFTGQTRQIVLPRQ
ncbi:hypothetical protein [Calothrix sp. UHCC 0171]|uniref:hypothetical protein n=1 Tax=Calothrix sp. UHCC 0171 TaxID=3110245 RepID=UPI002B1F31B3|nr:hypothetical protein [Calothrix sp. UHCC 0171]MEA5571102.1 hypothetical protein [Calothrix sp. UHCC 0171]